MALDGDGADSVYIGVYKGTVFASFRETVVGLFSMTPVCRYPCLLFVPVCVCMIEAVTIKNPVPAELCILFLPINGNFSICRDVWAYLWVSE